MIIIIIIGAEYGCCLLFLWKSCFFPFSEKKRIFQDCLERLKWFFTWNIIVLLPKCIYCNFGINFNMFLLNKSITFIHSFIH